MKSRLFTLGRLCTGIAASAGLGWLAARGLDWGQVSDAFRDVSPTLVLTALAVFLAASYLRAYRWKVLFINEPVSTNRLFVVQNIGIGLNNVVPVRVASEAAQLAILTLRDRMNPSIALATLGMERVVDIVASTLLLAIAFFLVPEMSNFTLYVWGAVGFTVVIVALVRLLAWGSHGIGSIQRIPFLAAFATAVKNLERERRRLFASLILTTIYWLVIGFTAWILARSIGLSISPTTATLAIIATIFFATAVPAAPSAIGSFEFAVVYVLEFFGVSHESGFGFAIITHAVFFLPPSILAAIFLPREGITSMGALGGQIRHWRAMSGIDAA